MSYLVLKFIPSAVGNKGHNHLRAYSQGLLRQDLQLCPCAVLLSPKLQPEVSNGFEKSLGVTMSTSLPRKCVHSLPVSLLTAEIHRLLRVFSSDCFATRLNSLLPAVVHTLSFFRRAAGCCLQCSGPSDGCVCCERGGYPKGDSFQVQNSCTRHPLMELATIL